MSRPRARDTVRRAADIRAKSRRTAGGSEEALRRAVRAVEPLEARTLMAAIVVNDLGDAVVVDGRVTLREALQSANANAPVNADVAASGAYGSDTVLFSPGLQGTLTLGGSELVVTDTLTVSGPGASALSISGNDLSTVLRVSGATTHVDVSGLSITHGKSATVGAGVWNEGVLSLTDCTISGNTGTAVTASNGSTITLTRCRVSDNAGSSATSAVNALPNSTVTLANCVVSANVSSSQNSAAIGGAGALILTSTTVTGTTGRGVASSRNATLTNCTLSNNSDLGFYILGTAATLTGCTISGNAGGGVRIANGSATLTNCTISGNTKAGSGAGLLAETGPVTLVNCTVTGNKATPGTFVDGGGVHRSGGTVRLHNTIVANNFLGAAPNDVTVSGIGTYDTSSSNNLIGATGAGTGIADGANGNRVGTVGAPLAVTLAPLAFNGGPTATHALPAGSLAIDAGSNARAQDPNGDGNAADALLTDQRGATRSRDGNGDGTAVVDIGSLEFNPSDDLPPFVSSVDASPSPSVAGDDTTLTLTAVGVGDPGVGDAVVRVDFYRETNGVVGLQIGAGGDLAVGSDASPVGGWSAAVGIGALSPGLYTYYAVATDGHGTDSTRDVATASVVHRVAAPLVVSTLADENDGDYSAGDLSLREALAVAAGQAGRDVIRFAPALSGGTITLDPALGELVVNSEVRIEGPGSDRLTLRRDPAAAASFRVIDVSTSLPVSVSGLTIAGGKAADFGGGVYDATGTLTMDGCVVTGNTAASRGGGVYGGTLTITNSVVSNNTASTQGGGILSLGTLTVTGSTISGNTVNGSLPAGGAVYAGAGLMLTGCTITGTTGPAVAVTAAATMSDSTIANNSGLGVNISGSANATVALTRCTLSGNAGGGAQIGGTVSVTLTNCTISGNTKTSSGAGLLVQGGTVVLTHCTVTGNTASATPFVSGGGIQRTGGALQLHNSIVAGNRLGTAPNDLTGTGTFPTSTFNLFGTIDPSSGITDGVNGNRTGTVAAPLDPRIGPLAFNGGPTATHALLAGSPAIDAGTNARAQDPNNDGDTTDALSTDQRGLARVRNGQGAAVADIGAVEFSATDDLPPFVPALVANPSPSVAGDDTVLTLTATGVTDPGVGDAVARVDFYREINGISGLQVGAGGDLAVATDADAAGGWSAAVPIGALPPGLYTYYAVATDTHGTDSTRNVAPASVAHRVAAPLIVSTLADENDGDYSAGDLSLREALAIAAGQAGRDVIRFAPALAGGTITLDPALGQLAVNSEVKIQGPGAGQLTVRRDPAATAVFRIFQVTSPAPVEISGLTVTGGKAQDNGGAINATGGFSVTVTSCVMTGNTAVSAGGGVYGFSVTLNDSVVSNNTASVQGGGVIATTLFMSGTTISGNKTLGGTGLSGDGGGVFVGSQATIDACTITGNDAFGHGDGVYLRGGAGSTAVVTRTTISGNKGSGLYADTGATAMLADSAVTANVAAGIEAQATTLTLTNTTVERNDVGLNLSRSSTRLTGSSVSANRGGIALDQGSLTMIRSTVDANTAGGVAIGSLATATMTDCTISNNTATGGDGGGISVGLGSTLTVTASAIVGNTARSGAGVYVGQGLTDTPTSATFYNTTISGNTATGPGGGLLASGATRLYNCTVSGNRGSLGGGISGTTFTYGVVAELHNTLVAGNWRSTRANPKIPNDLSGGFVASSSFNFVAALGDAAGGVTGITDGVNGNVAGSAAQPRDALLSPLARVGNGTWAHRLLRASPAIDAAANARVSDPNGDGNPADALVSDQTGRPRTRDGDGDATAVVDVGAYEADPAENLAPWIDSLKAAPDPAILGENPTVTLTAAGVTEPDPSDAVARIDFYRESNGVAGLQLGAGGDASVGTDTSALGGWRVQVSLAGLAAGSYQYYAVATDTHGAASTEYYSVPTATHRLAPVIVVSTAADENDGDYSPEDLSLREALALAAARDGYDVIRFAPSLDHATITLVPALGALNADSDVWIQGLGADHLTVRRDPAAATQFRVMTVPANVSVELTGLMITGGFGGGIATQGALTIRNAVITGNTGSGLYANPGASVTLDHCTLSNNVAPLGGGFYANQATVTATACTISGNQVSAAGGGGGGGFYAQTSSVTLTDSTITGNVATSASGLKGGGIYGNDSYVQLTGCTVSNNTSQSDGGGIYLASVDLVVDRSTISGNHAVGTFASGGGIYGAGDGPTHADITNSTISANTSDGNGGGIAAEFDISMSLINCTVSGNAATGWPAQGGGIYAAPNHGDFVVLTQCTVTDNRAYASGGGIASPNEALGMHNTIVAGNRHGVTPTATTPDDLTGTFNTFWSESTNNLVGVADGTTGIVGVANNRAGTLAAPLDPRLGPLTANGGPTATHALLPGSPAIDAGSDDRAQNPRSLISYNTALTTDQRGVGYSRFTGARVDIGAVEATTGTSPTVSSASFDGRRLRVVFSEDVGASLSLADLRVVDQATGADVPSAQFTFARGGGASSTEATWTTTQTLPDGDYRALIPAGAVRDADGNALAADFTFPFFVLSGDATQDRQVDFNDLVQLAQNYNTVGKTWRDGDFTGDGVVDFNDLVTLAQRYNTALPPPPGAAGAPAVIATGANATFAQARAVATSPTPAAVQPQPSAPAVTASRPAHKPTSKPLVTAKPQPVAASPKRAATPHANAAASPTAKLPVILPARPAVFSMNRITAAPRCSRNCSNRAWTFAWSLKSAPFESEVRLLGG